MTASASTTTAALDAAAAVAAARTRSKRSSSAAAESEERKREQKKPRHQQQLHQQPASAPAQQMHQSQKQSLSTTTTRKPILRRKMEEEYYHYLKEKLSRMETTRKKREQAGLDTMTSISCPVSLSSSPESSELSLRSSPEMVAPTPGPSLSFILSLSFFCSALTRTGVDRRAAQGGGAAVPERHGDGVFPPLLRVRGPAPQSRDCARALSLAHEALDRQHRKISSFLVVENVELANEEWLKSVLRSIVCQVTPFALKINAILAFGTHAALKLLGASGTNSGGSRCFDQRPAPLGGHLLR
jgi:hypothetical protein